MQARPDVAEPTVLEVLARCWGIQACTVSYLPVGFGAYHWVVDDEQGQWFLTVHDLGSADSDQARSASLRHIQDALESAVDLRKQGCDFVVTPVPTDEGSIVEFVDSRHVLSVFPYIKGQTGLFGAFPSQVERNAVLDCLVRLHSAEAPASIPTGDLAIAGRAALGAAMADLDRVWSGGPFAEPARQLLGEHATALAAALHSYDRLAAQVGELPTGVVVTHGEPHPGNVIGTTRGPVLVDWDTIALAPAERDIWRLIAEDPSVRHRYEAASGRMLNDESLRLFALQWDLSDVALFIEQFRKPHDDSPDQQTAWNGLRHHLDPERWQQLLSRS